MRRGKFKTHSVRSRGICLEEGRHFGCSRKSEPWFYTRGGEREGWEQSESKNEIELEDFYVSGVAGTEKRDFG